MEWFKKEAECECSEFSVCCYQRSRSSLLLLIIRCAIFLVDVALVTSSALAFPGWLYFIYFTHLGLLLILSTSFFSIIVSTRAYFCGLPNAKSGLPWYIKVYWVLFNITVPIAFLITIFYWVVLYPTTEYIPNLALDVSIHGANSLVMLAQLLIVAHPFRLLHIYQPVCVGLIYMLFTLIYYYLGGLDPFGNPYIYPVIDWSKPGETSVVLLLTALFLILMHILAVVIAALRDAIAKCCCRRKPIHNTNGLTNDAFDNSP